MAQFITNTKGEPEKLILGDNMELFALRRILGWWREQAALERAKRAVKKDPDWEKCPRGVHVSNHDFDNLLSYADDIAACCEAVTDCCDPPLAWPGEYPEV